MNIDKPVAHLVPSRLQHDGGVQHNQSHLYTRPRVGNLFADPALDPGKNQRFQRVQLLWIFENNRGQPPSADRPIRLQDPRAPAPHDLGKDLWLAQGLVAELVTGNQLGASAPEYLCHQAFATAYTAN